MKKEKVLEILQSGGKVIETIYSQNNFEMREVISSNNEFRGTMRYDTLWKMLESGVVNKQPGAHKGQYIYKIANKE
jgi:hypothetical protein